MNRLYVGNIPFNSGDAEIRAFFDGFELEKIHYVLDPDGRPRGFCFVDLGSADAAQAALETLDGTLMGGRRIKVAPARPKPRE